jgi:hypothetical protein
MKERPTFAERLANAQNPEYPLTYPQLLVELADAYSDARTDMVAVEIRLAEHNSVAERKRAELVASGELPGKTVGEREAALLLDEGYQACLANVQEGENAAKAARALVDIASSDLKVMNKVLETLFYERTTN